MATPRYDEILRRVLVSRNKLIEALILSLPRSSKEFEEALRMRDECWKNDEAMWDELREA